MRVDAQQALECRIDEPFGGDQPADVATSDERRYTGTLKWFDVMRGFGFIVGDEPGVGDILVHLSVLQAHGRSSLPEGARIECRAVTRNRGLQASQILSIDLTHAVDTSARPRSQDDRVDPASLLDAAGPFEGASVKWFNRLKGYGFLVRDSDGADIFVHMETLRRGGVIEIEPGQSLRVRIGSGRKGPLAVQVEKNV